jgi:two-component system chemotaxis sensor kinase CheA
MDRRILEELKDPLLHLIRNCIDHGIERPEARRAAGKPERAAVTVEVAVVDGDKVAVSIADDGAGIARDRVAATAARLGLLGADAAERPDSELLPLIFQSGLSTSPMITDLSGRGLGLAIVRERVERLGGTVTVDSQPGQGCIFRLVVPLTLATYRGILVRAAGRLFVIPTLGVERVVGVRSDEVGTIESRPVVEIGGTAVPLVRLSDVLELPPAPRPPEAGGRIVALVLGAMARRTAFAVDAIEGDQEVLMKPLGRYLVRVRNVQGATVLPTGQIAPILNIHDLLKSAAKAVRAGPAATAAERTVASARKSILLAEDSITARTLLKAILEGAGYHVKTSVDGMEAWANLKLEPFDLLVSDVEMPRMNGFELTERIRADPNLAELPIVLVTALDTREHRERGAEAGADAYITKGGFDQARLLETVRRLV